MRRIGTVGVMILALAGASPPSFGQSELGARRVGSDVVVNFSARGGACYKPGPARLGAPKSAIPVENATPVTVTLLPTGTPDCARKPMMFGFRWKITIPDVRKSTQHVIIYVVRRNGRRHAVIYNIESP